MHESPFVTGPEPRCVNLPLVHELVDGSLDAAGARRLEAHVAACEACADEARFVRALRAAAAELPRVVPGDHVWEGIAASIADAGGEDRSVEPLHVAESGDRASHGTSAPRRRRLPRAGGIAAALVPIVGVALLVGRFGREDTRQGPVANRAATPARETVQQNTTATGEPSTDAPSASAVLTGVQESASPARDQRGGSLTIRPAAAVPRPGGSDGDAGRGSLDLYGTALALENRSQAPATPAELDSQVVFDRERLAEAESAIRACNEALARNPDDVRVRAALLEAYDQKVRALRALIAAGEKRRPSVTATPVGYGGSQW